MNPWRTAIPRAVLDSNVIFSRVLHEFLGRLALEARLLDIVYSDELLAETKRVLMRDKPVGEPIAERWISYLRDAFPNGATSITNIPAAVDLASLTSDPDDEHVCALAIAAEANLLITFDTAFDHEALLAHGVRVVEPDAVLAPAYDEQPDLLLAILERQAAAWGGRSLSELLDALERAGVPGFARNVRAASSP